MSPMKTTITTGTGQSDWMLGQAGGGKSFGGLISGDMTTVGRLQASCRQADALAEQVQILLGMVAAAAASLPDRLAAASWGTQDITTAGNGIAQVVADQQRLDADALAGLAEQLQVMDHAVAAAEQLGAEVQSTRAEGEAEAFTQT